MLVHDNSYPQYMFLITTTNQEAVNQYQGSSHATPVNSVYNLSTSECELAGEDVSWWIR